MTNEEMVKALRCLRVETGSLSCLGCGYEHSCNVHGCQILREAAAQLEHFTAENRALRSALASRPAKCAQKQARDASVTYLQEMAKELNAQRAEAEAERDALLEKVPQWFSVEDRLPEVWINEEDDVLVNYMIYSPDFGVDIGNYHAKAKRWVCMGLPCSVTYWMPLPGAPEGK